MRLTKLAPLVLLLPLFAGCTGGSNGGSGGTGASAQGGGDEFKVALLTPGPVSDAGWNAMAYDGLQAVKQEMSATVDNQEATGTKIRDALRSYAQKQYRLVFGHGYEYNEPAVEVAKDFPETVFVTSSGGKTADNVGAFRFALEEGFYLAGRLASLMSKTGKIGAVALGGIPSIDSTLDAFEEGAKSVRSSIEVKRVYFQKDGDVAAAKRATEQLADSGCDFVIHQANAGAQGVFDAAKEKGIHAIGSNLNQNDNASGAVVASAFIIARPAFLQLAKEVKDKTFKGRIVQMGMADGAIEFAMRPEFESQVPDDIKGLLSETAEQIKQGTLKVPMRQF